MLQHISGEGFSAVEPRGNLSRVCHSLLLKADFWPVTPTSVLGNFGFVFSNAVQFQGWSPGCKKIKQFLSDKFALSCKTKAFQLSVCEWNREGQTMVLLKASGHQNRPAAWKWTAGRQRASVCAVCLFYLLRLSRAQGMPVGVLNAGSSFSPNSTAFLRNTWERNRTKTSNSLQDGSSWFLAFLAENITQHLQISISAQNPRLTPVAQCFPHPSTLYPFIRGFSSFLSASFYPCNVLPVSFLACFTVAWSYTDVFHV